MTASFFVTHCAKKMQSKLFNQTLKLAHQPNPRGFGPRHHNCDILKLLAGQFPGHSKKGHDMEVIQIQIKQVYGNYLYYPANDGAQVFARLAGKKTFSQADIASIRQLGFSIEYINANQALEV